MLKEFLKISCINITVEFENKLPMYYYCIILITLITFEYREKCNNYHRHVMFCKTTQNVIPILC